MADEKTWTAVDSYLEEALLGEDPALGRATEASDAAGLPRIAVSPLQGRMLELLARSAGARRVLEIGTLGGYSTIHLARAVGAEGRVVTLEYAPKHAEVARESIAAAGLADIVEIRVGAALDLLPGVESAGLGPFDLFFIDADKENNAEYVQWAMRLSRPGSMIIVDNVIRDGKIVDPDDGSAMIEGTRRMYDLLRGHEGLDATAVQTVGVKGYDGFLLAVTR